MLDATGLAPGSLRLEMHESALLGDAAAVERTLRALRALGVRLALDNFGTGYSALSSLHRFPVDTLKIDRAFVTGLEHDPADAAIVGAVIALGTALGVRVITEGVETAAQAAKLQALGCELAQGHYFATPLPSEAFAALLAGAPAARSW